MCRILNRFLALLVPLAVRSGRSKDLEIIVLRHQLGVLHRRNNRPQLADEDRALLGAVTAALPRPQRAGWLVTPDTLLRWHRRRIAPTVRSISDHPSPPTLQTSQMGTSKSSRRPLRRTHQRVPKCRLTRYDTVFGTHTARSGPICGRELTGGAGGLGSVPTGPV